MTRHYKMCTILRTVSTERFDQKQITLVVAYCVKKLQSRKKLVFFAGG